MAQLLGTGRPDLFELKGTAGNIVYGYGGDDDFFDSAGADWMRGAAGNDQFYSTGGSDLMFGGSGDDQFNVTSADANIMIRGGGGFDELVIVADLFAPGEADQLQYVLGGALYLLADGSIIDIAGIEHVTLI